MSKVTSKLQVTIPKAVADRYGIAPGDEIEWVAAADSVRIVPAKALKRTMDTATRLRLFDAATKRQRRRQAQQPTPNSTSGRGWNREELYGRGHAR